MKTRMQPIGNVLQKFPRVVRDLAQSCGKRAEIEMEGAETGLDRTIIEAVRDPLTHVVRTRSITASSRATTARAMPSRR